MVILVRKMDSKGMSWMSVVPRAQESFDLSVQQWHGRVQLQYGWDQGLPERCNGCGKRFSTDHALICMEGELVGWGHNQPGMSWGSSAGRPGATAPGSQW